MKKILTILALATVAVCCGGANYYRELLMLPRVAAGGGNTYYTDPYAANLIARYDFDATAWTNDVTANAFNLGIDGSGTTVSNVIVGTNIYGRAEKAAYFSAGQRLRKLIPQAEFTAWSNTSTLVSYWIYRARTNTGEYAFGFGGTNAFDDGVMANFAANNLSYSELVRSNGSSIANGGFPGTTTQCTSSNWIHIAEFRTSSSAVYNKGWMVWINGIFQPHPGSADPIDFYAYDKIIKRLVSGGLNGGLSFGDRPGSQSAFRGLMDNTRIYNSAAATNNIAWLYQYTHPTNNLETR